MKRKWMYLLTALVVASMLLAPAAPVAAQGGEPPVKPEDQPGFAIEDEALLDAGLFEQDGLYAIEGPPLEEADDEVGAMAAYSSPDAFGYRYQKVTPAWIDATGGTVIDIDDYAMVSAALPFPFRFYGKVYEEIDIVKYGYLAFGNTGWISTQSEIGREDEPNNVIAPYWAPTQDSQAYMLAGGVAPNRWVVIEWYHSTDQWGGNRTFEAVLYENGQILFQYDAMNYANTWWCGTAGIEDRSGLIYKKTLNFCKQQADYKAVRFFPPKPAARVRLYPEYYGGLGMPGETARHHIYVENNGDLGADVFDLVLASAWPGTLYYEDGINLLPLVDTDGDGRVDTGAVAEGEVFDVVVEIVIPPTTLPGKPLESTLKITSSLNKYKTKTARMHTAVPTNFAQVLSDSYDQLLLTFEPGGRREHALDSDLGEWWDDTGLVENATGRLFYFGTDGYCVDEPDCFIYVAEPHLAVLDRNGGLVGEHVLRDLSGATADVYASYMAAAPTPDGSVGFTWQERTYDSGTGYSIYNLFFMVVDADGNVTSGPVNLTNNTTPNYPRYYDSKLAAGDAGKFVVSWEAYERPGSTTIYSVYHAVVNASDGSFAFGPAVLGQGQYTYPVINLQYFNPSAMRLANGKTLLAWVKYLYKYSTRRYSYTLEYAVVDSAGNQLKRGSVVTGSASVYDIDAAQMSNGQIVLAWDGYSNNKAKIYYAILNGTTYAKTKGPVALNSAASLSPGINVSVTVDQSGHAILTWLSSNQRQAYYALLGSNGVILTKPMIYRTGWYQPGYDAITNMWTSYNGFGNTTFTVP